MTNNIIMYRDDSYLVQNIVIVYSLASLQAYHSAKRRVISDTKIISRRLKF